MEPGSEPCPSLQSTECTSFPSNPSVHLLDDANLTFSACRGILPRDPNYPRLFSDDLMPVIHSCLPLV